MRFCEIRRVLMKLYIFNLRFILSLILKDGPIHAVTCDTGLTADNCSYRLI